MISIKTTTALIMAVSSILGVAPIAALADNTNTAAIDDRDTNTQVNAATQVLTQGEGDNNVQAAAAGQSNSLSDDDQNAIFQSIFD
jgi:hypothetical protein